MPFVYKSTIHIFDKSLFKFDNQTICKSEWQMIKELQDINWKLFGLPCSYSTAKCLFTVGVPQFHSIVKGIHTRHVPKSKNLGRHVVMRCAATAGGAF